jgi:hypothetical protein
MLVCIGDQIFDFSADKDDLAYATSKLTSGGLGPNRSLSQSVDFKARLNILTLPFF